MKTLPHTSKAAIGAALLAVLFATGCERRAQEPETANETPAADVGTAPQAPSEPAATPVPEAGETSAAATNDGDATADEHSRSTGTVIDDSMITAKVKTALLADADIKGLNVDVDTSEGVVALNGEVQNQAQLDRAAKLAGEVDGVKSVLNNLTIKQ